MEGQCVLRWGGGGGAVCVEVGWRWRAVCVEVGWRWRGSVC